MIQQPGFTRHAAAVAGHAAIFADHPMTGDHDRNPIGSVCRRHGAEAVGLLRLSASA